jgi:site-specific DNA-methyltransferase (adenine-specific)
MKSIPLRTKHCLYFNQDCISGCKEHIPDNSVDLIVTDPPYGIAGDTLHKHYRRNEKHVIGGYVEVPQSEYSQFSVDWIMQAERILRPGGSLYIVSGYTNLVHILNALNTTALKTVNHLVWKYNFGVYTKKKYISSHYHILYCIKKGKPPTFNTYCRFGQREKDAKNGSLNYLDREDVWTINREFKPGRKKNKNELPSALLTKIIQYSSNEGAIVCDLFLGSFSTAKIAIGLNRKAIGFEINRQSFSHNVKTVQTIAPGSLLQQLRKPDTATYDNQRKRWDGNEKSSLLKRYQSLRAAGRSKKETITLLSEAYGRGYFALLNIIGGKTK